MLPQYPCSGGGRGACFAVDAVSGSRYDIYGYQNDRRVIRRQSGWAGRCYVRRTYAKDYPAGALQRFCIRIDPVAACDVLWQDRSGKAVGRDHAVLSADRGTVLPGVL